MDISLFATAQLSLLETEYAVETAQQTTLITSLPPTSLQRHGLALLNLTISTQHTGLGGRTILDLIPDSSISSVPTLPTHGLRSGDVIQLAPQPSGAAKKKEKASLSEQGVGGVVHRVTDTKLVVAVQGEGDDAAIERLVGDGKRLWAVKMANEVTHKRMVRAVEMLKGYGERGDATPLMRVLFGISEPGAVRDVGDVGWLDEGLNDSQREAVKFALGSEDIALIHGPPGTGKTQTLLEVIRQLTAAGKRVLVCGPSNISVDNIVLRLPPDLPCIRLGHPARLLPRVVERSLDVLSQTSEAGEIVKDVRIELDELLAKLIVGGKNRIRGKERKEGWDQVKHLRGEFRRREQKTTRDLMTGSKVVLSTLHGAGGRQLFGQKFDVLVIDEGSQALEAQCWIPLLLSTGISKLILAGDHLQLPPTVKSTGLKDVKTPNLKVQQPNEKRFRIPTSLEDTLFSRLLTLHGPKIKRLLNVQYRMHQQIMQFPSDFLYESKLTAAPQVATHLLSDLDHVQEDEDTCTATPVLFLDTQGGDFPEAPVDAEQAKSTPSHSNPLEAALAIQHVRALIAAGVKPSEIAVITPYNAQLALLVAGLRQEYPELEMGSVDGFQGREKEAVVFSLVRSNEEKEVGFLKEKRRLNVAMTRARRHLCVIGDSETLSGRRREGYLGEWCKWVEEGGEVRYPDVADVWGENR